MPWRAYARQSNNTELEVQVAEIKLRALRRLGELSKELEKTQGARHDLTSSQQREEVTKAQHLKEAGISTSAANKQYKENYSTFEDYCIERWDIKRNFANKLISASNVVDNLLAGSEMGTIVPKNESQTRQIAKAPPEEQAEVWQQAQEDTGKEQPTAKEIKQVVDKKVHVSNNSGENEWYTPAKFIDSATLVMGHIDLDPASSELANQTVCATEYFTKENSGLDVTEGNKAYPLPC